MALILRLTNGSARTVMCERKNGQSVMRYEQWQKLNTKRFKTLFKQCCSIWYWLQTTQRLVENKKRILILWFNSTRMVRSMHLLIYFTYSIFYQLMHGAHTCINTCTIMFQEKISTVINTRVNCNDQPIVLGEYYYIPLRIFFTERPPHRE